jgi:hypothetical protein
MTGVWAPRVSIAAGLAAIGAAISYVGPHAWVTSRALTVPLRIAPAWVWALCFAVGGIAVLLGASMRHRGVRACGHTELAIVYLVFFGALFVAWVITLAQWVTHQKVDASLLPYGAAPFLPMLAVVVNAACAIWARGRRTENVVRVVE